MAWAAVRCEEAQHPLKPGSWHAKVRTLGWMERHALGPIPSLMRFWFSS
jgi:hypothetical protein